MNIVKLNLDNVMSNEYASTMIGMFLALYGGLAAPNLPKPILAIFKQDIFRVIFLSLIAYTSTKDTRTAIMMSVVFIISLNTLNKRESEEGFKSLRN